MKTVLESREFVDWLKSHKDPRTRTIIASRVLRLARGLGDTKTVGGGVSELRIDHGPGYRVYFTERQMELVILLCGGDKSSQARDIKRAQVLAQEV